MSRMHQTCLWVFLVMISVASLAIGLEAPTMTTTSSPTTSSPMKSMTQPTSSAPQLGQTWVNRYCGGRTKAPAKLLSLVKGGSIMTSTVKVYHIWVGNWTLGERQVLDYLSEHLDTTAWFNINSNGIFDAAGVYATESVVLGGSYSITRGSFGSMADVISQIFSASNIFGFPIDDQSVYFVFPSRSVFVNRTVSGTACGWHNMMTQTVHNATVKIKFGMVFDKDYCSVQSLYPLGRASHRTQVMASILAHEIVEAISDPDPRTAWYNATNGLENADICGFCFGMVQTDSNGTSWNINIGPLALPYLIQQNYDPRRGLCASTGLKNSKTVAYSGVKLTETCTTKCNTTNAVCSAGTCKCPSNYVYVAGSCYFYAKPATACPAPVLNANVNLPPLNATVPVRTTLPVSCANGTIPTVESITCMGNGLWDAIAACISPSTTTSTMSTTTSPITTTSTTRITTITTAKTTTKSTTTTTIARPRPRWVQPEQKDLAA